MTMDFCEGPILLEFALQVQFKLSFCATILVGRWPPVPARSDVADAWKAEHVIDEVASIFQTNPWLNCFAAHRLLLHLYYLACFRVIATNGPVATTIN